MFLRHKRSVPQLNTASVADISFMLLILFLVVTSMDVDKGLTRQLPPIAEDEALQERDVNKRNVMQVTIDEQDRLIVDGTQMDTRRLGEKLMMFIDNPDNLSDLPEKREKNVPLLGKCSVTDRHVIQLEAARTSSYNLYFQVQNTIVGAYKRLRDNLARQRFHRSYDQCDDNQKKALREVYPQRVSEVYAEGKGEQP